MFKSITRLIVESEIIRRERGDTHVWLKLQMRTMGKWFESRVDYGSKSKSVKNRNCTCKVRLTHVCVAKDA